MAITSSVVVKAMDFFFGVAFAGICAAFGIVEHSSGTNSLYDGLAMTWSVLKWICLLYYFIRKPYLNMNIFVLGIYICTATTAGIYYSVNKESLVNYATWDWFRWTKRFTLFLTWVCILYFFKPHTISAETWRGRPISQTMTQWFENMTTPGAVLQWALFLNLLEVAILLLRKRLFVLGVCTIFISPFFPMITTSTSERDENDSEGAFVKVQASDDIIVLGFPVGVRFSEAVFPFSLPGFKCRGYIRMHFIIMGCAYIFCDYFDDMSWYTATTCFLPLAIWEIILLVNRRTHLITINEEYLFPKVILIRAWSLIIHTAIASCTWKNYHRYSTSIIGNGPQYEWSTLTNNIVHTTIIAILTLAVFSLDFLSTNSHAGNRLPRNIDKTGATYGEISIDP